MEQSEKKISVTFEGTSLFFSQAQLKKQSLLDIALENGINLDHACGGVCACSTCHVIIDKGLETCNALSEQEEDQLDKAPGVTARSRLACQCFVDGTQDVVIQVPVWNRNFAREKTMEE